MEEGEVVPPTGFGVEKAGVKMALWLLAVSLRLEKSAMPVRRLVPTLRPVVANRPC